MFKFGRVLLPAGAFGYYTVKRKVDDISSSLPNFRDYIPEIDLQNWTDSISETSRTLNEWLDEANQAIKNNTRMPEKPKDWDISKKQLATAILDNETQQKQLEAQHDQVKKSITQVITAKLKSVGSSPNNTTSNKNKETIEISVDELEHLKKLEIEYIGLRKKLERLEKEKRGYEAQLRGSGGSGSPNGSSKGKRKLNSQRSLIDLYSEVLDELSGYDSTYRMADHLPKVVVVGDQSSGKTSVLEMIAGARIFPRGAGEMMTRAPVQVTLSEGPYHIARFNDTSREYDLTKEPELADLRREIEERMRRSVQGGKTVSNQVISLSIQGPGIQRMVLVDLPGIIGTVTTELAPDTKECIKKMVTEYMGNPNAIILCIQDGSLDAERSIFTDLVREVDEKGRRTILVLTKVDIAEETHKNPSKIKKILDGELFPMKALGYYAVVAGKSGQNEDIQQIRDYEEKFFRTSALRRNGILNPGQCTTSKLSSKVSECFWDMVRASIGEQAVAYKATLYNLEAEWDQLFPHKRQLTRDELFEDARYEILNEVAEFTRLSEKHWTQIITSQLWQQINDHIMQRIYFPASRDRKQPSPTVDFELNRWIDSLELPNMGIKIAQQSLKYQFDNMLESKPPFDQKSKARQSWSSGKRDDSGNGSADDDPTIYKELKRAVIYDALERHQWNSQALNALKSTQKQAVSKQTKLTEENWRNSIDFLSTKLTDLMKETANELTNLLGLSFVQRWMQWSYISPDQRLNQMIQLELEKALTTPDPESLRYAELGDQELNQIKRNLVSQGIDVDAESIRKLWIPFHRHHFLINEIARAKLCKSLYSYYENDDNSSGIDCHHVELFGRIKRLVESTVETLRYQIMADECKRIEKQISKVLDEYREDEAKKAELLNGKRVELAQELKRVRHIQEKLEEFEQELNRESKG